MCAATAPREPNTDQHLVTRSWQNNFGDSERKVTVLDAETGSIVQRRRSTRRNYTEAHFNSFTTATSPDDFNTYVEEQWSKIETTTVHTARNITRTTITSEQRAAIAQLFAMHLVRSRPFREAHSRKLAATAADYAARTKNDRELHKLYAAQYGREPTDADLAEKVAEAAVDGEERNTFFTGSMINIYNGLVQKFAGYYVQVIESLGTLPGFILPDVPVLHVDLATQRIGFRNDLAPVDATFILAPLTRHTAACLTSTRVPHKLVTTKKLVQTINAALWRSADREVACHPDDAREAQRVFEHLERLPISNLG
jgi:hypothetical protein